MAAENTLQQNAKRASFGGIELIEQPGFETAEHALRPDMQFQRGGQEMHGMRPPVGRMLAPLDQTTLFHVVDKPDHHVAVHSEQLTELC